MHLVGRWISSAAVLVGLVGLCGTALADATLYSPALQIADDSRVNCAVTNVDTKPRTISAAILLAGGTDATDMSDCGVEVPGAVCSASATQDGGGSSAMYCKVVVKGSKKGVRATFSIQEGTGPTRQTVLVVPVE